MKKLKDLVKKPAVKWIVGGATITGIGALILTNIGLSNQNRYLFNRFVETGRLYVSSVDKSIKLKEDNQNQLKSHFQEMLPLMKENIKLRYNLDSINAEYINFVEKYIEEKSTFLKDFSALEDSINESKRNLFREIINLTEEREFFRAYASYLDSLLTKYESEGMIKHGTENLNQSH